MAEVCRRCDSTLGPGAAFCSRCGTPQDLARADAAQRLTEERIALLCRYLPNNLVRHLSVERQAPLGQRSVAAVVFADVSGFTAMSERMEPEEVLRVMNGCFEGMVEAVENHGGTVDKFIGDCLMAVFGVPAAHADDAARAVRACREMFTYLDRYNKTLAKPLGLSIGINYGPLVAGNLGSRFRMDYTVLGNTVNLSQRLEAAATAGQIMVSEAVKRAAENEIEFEPMEPIRVKGISQPVQIYLAKGDRAASQARKEIPCVGRAPYLAALEKALAEPGDRPIAFDFYGDDGVGKTRIVEAAGAQWAARAADARKLVIARAPGAGRLRSYAALGSLVDAVCGIEWEDSAGQRALKTSRLGELGVGPEWRLFLLHVASGAQASVGDLDGNGIRSGLLAAVKQLLERLAGQRCVVILDAYDRYDADSLDILRRIFAEPMPAGSKLLTTRGKSAEAMFAAAGQAKFAEIKPLDMAGCDALASARLGLAALPPAAAQFLARQAGGNPRYLLELIESLLESGHIYLTGDGYVVRDDLAGAASGLSLVSLIRSRFDRLPVDQRYLLQAAALYGISFPADVVCEAAGQDAGSLALAGMAEKGLLVRKDSHFRFAHPMIYDVATDSLLTGQRQNLFTQLGNALEGHAEGRNPENLPLLARFFEGGDDAGKAAYFLEKSADYLFKKGEFERAAKGFAALAERQEKSNTGNDAVARTHIQAGRALEKHGKLGEALGSFQAAARLAAAAGSSLRQAHAARHVARMHRLQGNLTEAAAEIELALASSLLSDHAGCEAWTLLEAAEIDVAAQRVDLAAERLGEAEKRSTGLTAADEEGSVRGRVLSRLGRLSLGANQLDQAARLLEEAAAVCDAGKDSVELVRVFGNLGILYHRGGQKGAQPYFDRALALARSIGDRLGEAKQLHNLGSYLLSVGDKEGALACFNQSYDLAKAMDWSEGVAVNANAIRGLETV